MKFGMVLVLIEDVFWVVEWITIDCDLENFG